MFLYTPIGHDHVQTSKALKIVQVSKIRRICVLQVREDHLTSTQVTRVYCTPIGYYLSHVLAFRALVEDGALRVDCFVWSKININLFRNVFIDYLYESLTSILRLKETFPRSDSRWCFAKCLPLKNVICCPVWVV